jgi:Fe-S cluster assembly iron-binding protein IscA
MMITVTERAMEELKAILVAIEASPDEGLRLLPTDAGEFVLGIDTEMSADQVVKYEGYKVLLVGIEYFQTLNGKTVDCKDTGEGTVIFVR